MRVYLTTLQLYCCGKSLGANQLYTLPIPCIHQMYLGALIQLNKKIEFPSLYYTDDYSYNLTETDMCIFAHIGRKTKRMMKTTNYFAIKTSLKFIEETIDIIIEYTNENDREKLYCIVSKRI